MRGSPTSTALMGTLLALAATPGQALELPGSRVDAGYTAVSGGPVTLSASVAQGAGRLAGGTLDMAVGTGPITGLVDLPILPEIAATAGNPLNRRLVAPWTEAGTWSATGLPSGVVITGEAITGIPTIAGLSVVRLRYTTGAGIYTEQEVQLRTAPAPTDTNGDALASVLVIPDTVLGGSKPATPADLTMDLTSGSDFSYRIPAERGARVVFSGLPTWATDQGDGIMAGTVGTPGVTIVTATVTTLAGVAATTTITLTVTDPVAGTAGPVTLKPVTQVMTLSETLRAPLLVVGNLTGVVFEADGLPPGMVINSTTGLISGFPTVSGTYLIRIRAVQRTGSRADEGTVLARTTMVLTVLPKTPVHTEADLGERFIQDATGQGGCGLGSGLAVLLGGLALRVVGQWRDLRGGR